MLSNKIAAIMLSKKVWPFAAAGIVGLSFWAYTSFGTSKDGTPNKQQILLQTIGAVLEEKHFSPKKINDAFSKSVFKEYFEKLDSEKNIFLQSDINSLKKYETTIDDEIKGSNPVQFYTAVGEIFKKRIQETRELYRIILAKPFTFNTDESVVLDADQLNFCPNEKERAERWRKRLKYMVLERFVELQEQRDNAAKRNKTLSEATITNEATNEKPAKVEVDTMATKTDAELEVIARTRVLKTMERFFDRNKKRLEDNEQFSLFLNTITEMMDPHTEYFAPIEKRAFDEQMSNKFFGIGAQLREEEAGMKIASIVPGSPAFKSGELQVGDMIIKVAQGAGEPVDIAGYAIDDAVKLIRGEKGTEVRLTVKKADGATKVVSLIREKIVQDEAAARSAVITQPDGKRIGYIYLPEFYADFENPNGSRASVDVAGEVMKLKAEKIDGLVIDLRNNGGGSLYEVVRMVGLFIKTGPVVQVKDKDGAPQVLEDRDPSVLYNGPLAVMVNELSASASEIFAAAIQDYKRGIVVGSTSTFGKGTVQKTLPLGKQVDFFTGRTDGGALKLTFEKFYRINGGSTQLKGVYSDVVIPDTYEYLKFREKDTKNALAWDQIPAAPFKTSTEFQVDDVVKTSTSKIAQNKAFVTLRQNAAWLSNRSSLPYSLNITKYKQEQTEVRDRVKQNDNALKLANDMQIEALIIDKDKFYNNPDQAKGERYQQWLKNLRTDIYINETADIVSLLLSKQAVFANNK
jgi:carboxyl-terminal processing protease